LTAQYENRKTFLNLIAEWHFFDTSQSKKAFDGLRGTVKKLIE
jgi:hypothetical protein